jgi:hypothetical protein
MAQQRGRGEIRKILRNSSEYAERREERRGGKGTSHIFMEILKSAIM